MLFIFAGPAVAAARLTSGFSLDRTLGQASCDVRALSVCLLSPKNTFNSVEWRLLVKDSIPQLKSYFFIYLVLP